MLIALSDSPAREGQTDRDGEGRLIRLSLTLEKENGRQRVHNHRLRSIMSLLHRPSYHGSPLRVGARKVARPSRSQDRLINIPSIFNSPKGEAMPVSTKHIVI